MQKNLHVPGDHDLVERAVAELRGRWHDEIRRLILDLGHDLTPERAFTPRDFIDKVQAAWTALFDQQTPALDEVIDAAVTRGFGHIPQAAALTDRLVQLGKEWLRQYGRTLVERQIVPLIESTVHLWEHLHGVESALVESLGQLLDSMPTRFEAVMQPLIRRLLIFAALQTNLQKPGVIDFTEELHRLLVQKADDPIAHLRATIIDPQGNKRVQIISLGGGFKAPAEAPPEDQQYVIVTAGDDRVCPVCDYLSTVGPFPLSVVLDMVDEFLSAAEDGVLVDKLPDITPFVTIDDIEGLSVEQLIELGVVAPAFHPRCRCGIAFV